MAKSSPSSSRKSAKPQRPAKSKPKSVQATRTKSSPKSSTRKSRGESGSRSAKRQPSAQELQLVHELMSRVSSAVMVDTIMDMVSPDRKGKSPVSARDFTEF